MRDKNNWSHKNDLRKTKVFNKLMKTTLLEKPTVHVKLGVIWGSYK